MAELTKNHATEVRERTEIRLKECYCVEPGCEYEGKRAVQGHCFSRLDDEVDRYITRLELEAENSLSFYRDQYSGSEYLEALESMYVSAMMNWSSALDQLIRLRRENAALLRNVPKPDGADKDRENEA